VFSGRKVNFIELEIATEGKPEGLQSLSPGLAVPRRSGAKAGETSLPWGKAPHRNTTLKALDQTRLAAQGALTTAFLGRFNHLCVNFSVPKFHVAAELAVQKIASPQIALRQDGTFEFDRLRR
jgi:hypothetical protein